MESLARAANRGSVSTGYDIDNSLKLEDDNTENLYRALNASTSTTKFTVSMWFKRTELGASQLLYHRGVAGNEGVFLRTSTETNDALQVDIGASGTNSRSYTNALLRDTSAWYHVVLAVDTTQSTATDRFKLYLNGTLITDFASRNNPAEDFAMEVSSAKHRHGAYNDTDGYAGYCGYIAECHYIDGSQEAQTEFGEFDGDSGIWKPKAYAGSYGTGGYYLDFSDSSALGNNSAGDGTDFTLNNIAAADQATDTPTNNFQTFLSDGTIFNSGQDNMTFSEGGTKYSRGQTGWTTAYTNIAMTNGKWYMEFENHGTGSNTFFGLTPVARATSSVAQNYYIGQASDGSIGYYMANGQIYWQGSSSGGVSSSTGDIIGVAVDIDNNKAYWHKNGTYMNSADPAAGSNGSTINDEPYFFACSTYNPSISGETNTGGYSSFAISSAESDANGYGTFEYAPPSGFYALCTKNLAEYG